MSKHLAYIKTPLNGCGPSFVVADVEDVVIHCVVQDVSIVVSRLLRLEMSSSFVGSVLHLKKHFYFSII